MYLFLIYSASAQAQNQQDLITNNQPPTQAMLPSLQHVSTSQHKRRRRLRDFTLQIFITWLAMVMVSNNKILVTISNGVYEQHKLVFGDHYLSTDNRYWVDLNLYHSCSIRCKSHIYKSLSTRNGTGINIQIRGLSTIFKKAPGI